MFYAAVNRYATGVSVGFANTWGVIGFATKKARDNFVNHAKDMATRPIKYDEIRIYGGKPGEVELFDDSCKKSAVDYWDSI